MFAGMPRSLAVLLISSALAASAQGAAAQDLNDRVRGMNAMNDMARAQRDQAESLRRIERGQRDQARRVEQDRINAQRDARSLRRFDRP